MQSHPARWILGVILISLLAGCVTEPYTRYDNATRVIGDNIVRYGSIGAAGAGGYFLGQKFIGGSTGGALGAIGASAIAYGITKFYDNKRRDAYIVGIRDGEANARSEIVNELWRREAVYGMPPPWEVDAQGGAQIRNVYVPTRTINDVQYPGDYQRVPVYR
jgi:hypothetical protein